ncbi:MAG TPA: hypothetical protein VLK84_26705 [Longimicrobium sp.]|nr:hypothetical protein [Longimicrobium sp.]
MRSEFRKAALVAAAVLLAGACGDDPNPVEPPTTGSLTITVETVGGLPDPNGYQVTRTGAAPLELPVNGSVRLDSLAPGSYSFALGKASLYCTVENGTTRDAQVVAGQTAQVSFRVRCERNGLAYVAGTSVGPLRIAFPGREPVVLATDAAPARIQFSPDRRRILYVRRATDGAFGIASIDLDSLGLTLITPAGPPNRSQATWSPDGTRIVYTTSTQLRTLRVGEAAETVIWQGSLFAAATDPAWSPNGARIAHLLSENGTRHIALINADGTGAQRVAGVFTLSSLSFQMDWSPDGTTIVFPDFLNGRQAIYTVNVASGDKRLVASSEAQHYGNPSYLPDGRIGFYAFNPDETLAGNFTVNADGSGRTAVAIPGVTGGALITAWQ